MPRIAGHITIARPADVVFDTVADQTQEPAYNPHMLGSRRLTAGALGEGTKFAAVARSRGRRVPMTVEITEYDRPRHHLRTHTRMLGAEVDGTLTCRPVPVGTELAWDWDLTLEGVGKVLSPLVGVLGRRQERRVWTGLRDYLESPPPVTPLQRGQNGQAGQPGPEEPSDSA